MSTDPYNSLLDEMERTAPRQPRAPKVAAPKPAGNRYGAYEAQTEGDWSIARAPAVKDWYRATYGRDLPVTAEGQSRTHTARGLNHADSLDVGLNPTTPEGQAFASYLKENRIPYLAYDRAVPNAATGAHFHVGHPSKRGAAQPADPYDTLLDELESSPATPVSETTLPQSPEAGAATPAASQVNQAPAGARPPQPTGYLDETQERPEDFARLQPPRTPKIDPYTQEGRAQRDVRLQAEKEGGALYRVPVGQGVKQAVETIAKDTDIPAAFVEDWLKQKGLGLYDRQTGQALESSPTGFAAIPAEMLGQLRKDYRASLSLPARAVRNVGEVLSTHSPGEVLTGVGGEVGATALRGLDLATRPTQALDAAFWAKVRGAKNLDAVKAAYDQFFGDNPELGKNVIAEALRDSDTLKGLNPRLPDLAAFFGEWIAPSVLLGGLGAKAATRLGRIAKPGGRLAQAAGELRDLGLAAPDIPREAFKAAGDTRVLGDLTRRAVPEVSTESLPDIPVGTLEAPRVVRNRAQAEPGVSEVVSVPERAATAPQASNGPVTETIIHHSNPRIDGGRVVGQTSDGRLRVENNEGGVSVIQHPRRQGNREATLVKREVEADAGQGQILSEGRPSGGARGEVRAEVGQERVGGEADRVRDGEQAEVGRQEGQVAPQIEGATHNLDFKGAMSNLGLDAAYGRDTWERLSRGKKVLFSERPGSLENYVQREFDAGRVKSADDITAIYNDWGAKKAEAANVRAQAPDGAEVQGAEAAGRGAEAAPQPPPVRVARPADAAAAPTAGARTPAEVATPVVEYKKVAPVKAEVSKEPFEWKTSDGEKMRAAAGDWKVTQPDGTVSSVKPGIFSKTYEPAKGQPGAYVKTTTTKAQQLDGPLDIETLEGKGHGERGDYLVTGPEGEQYIVPRKKFEELYRPAAGAQSSQGAPGPRADVNARTAEMHARHRDAVRAGFKSGFRLDDERADGVMELVDARARAWGKENNRPAGAYYFDRFGGILGGEKGPRTPDGTEAKGLTKFMADTRAILKGFQKSDVSTAVHEFAHVFRRDLPPNLLADAESALGVKGGKWTSGQEEAFGRGFERYLRDGTYPDVKLRRVFESFKNWLTEIYPSIRSKASPLFKQANPELFKTFDKALGGVERGEYGQLIHALHKAPDAGTPAFFENAQVKRALGLKPDASTADVRAALTEAVGKPRSSHLSPDDVTKWADSKGLQGAARVALDDAVAKFETKTAKVDAAPEPLAPADHFADNESQFIEDYYAGKTTDAEFAKRAEDAGLSKPEIRAAQLDAREARGQRSGGAVPPRVRAGETAGGGGAGRNREGDVKKGRKATDSDVLYQSAEPLPDEVRIAEADKQFPRAGEVVDGRRVREHVPNMASISAGFNDYEVLPGIREVPMSVFSGEFERTRRTLQLAEEIKASGELNPLIVAIDAEGPYILEGGHRYDALGINGAKSIPAVVVLDLDTPADILYQSSESEVLRRFREATAKARTGEARRLETTIADLERRIEERDITPAGKRQPRAVTAEVAQLRARRDELRKEYDALRRGMPVQGPKLSEAPKQGPRLTEAPRQGPKLSEAPKQGPKLSERVEPPTLTDRVARYAGVFRSLKSSWDLSAAGRQAAMYTVTHPARATRLFFGKQLASLRETNYDTFVKELGNHPRARQMRDAELYLASQAGKDPKAVEEAFPTDLAGRIPLIGRGVKASERAYVTFLDAARADWFDQLARQAEDAAKVEGTPLSTDDFKAIATVINRATGRGSLGKGAINDAAPLLNSIFFAPRYTVSRVQVLDPRIYARLPKGARQMAIRQAVQYYGTLATTAALLSYMGLEVGTDPETAEFMKLKVGDTRYDLTAGQGQYVTLAARLHRNFQNRREGKPDPFGNDASANLARWARYKLAPLPAFALNVAKGKDAVGQPTSLTKESVEAISPIFLKDMYEAFEREGLLGVAKESPAFVGIGVNTYKPRTEGPKVAVPTPRTPKPPKVSL